MIEMSNNIKVGIDRIGLYVPYHCLDMVNLANEREVDPNKFLIGIGQSEMAVPTPNEDIVAMGLNAADKILTDSDRRTIDQVIFATESGVDHSKSAAVYIHDYLGIQPFASCVEVKQACYSGTRALLMASDHVRLNPERKVLVVMADIARYGLKTGGESTQGGGALAMIVQSNPRILAFDPESVPYSENCYDFWRPIGEEFPLVDGKYSQDIYLDVWKKAVEEYNRRYPERLSTVKAVAYHTPFTKMAYKALNHDLNLDSNLFENWKTYYEDMTALSRRVGNIYTGSLYLSLISLLDKSDQLKAGERIGLFSYGSGAVGEFFTGVLQDGYKELIKEIDIAGQLDRRKEISVAQYEEVFESHDLSNSLAEEEVYYLAKIEAGQRTYKKN